MPRKPLSAEIVAEGETRVVITAFDDGEIVRTVVDPDQKPARRPRRPVSRARVKDFTRKKQIQVGSYLVRVGTTPRTDRSFKEGNQRT
jgi:hypothetical protein